MLIRLIGVRESPILRGYTAGNEKKTPNMWKSDVFRNLVG